MKKKSRPRRYDNSLRQEQADHTARRILDAVQARLGKGDRELAYAAIAREAKVSVPTVYRHFPTMDDIFRAFADREAKRHGHVTVDRGALPDLVRGFFARFDDPNDVLRAAPRLGQLWQFSRVGTVPPRKAYFNQLVEEAAPHLTAQERAIVVDAGVVVMSSAMGEAFAGYLELTGNEMAERAQFILEALLARAELISKKRDQEETPRGTR